VGLEIPDNGPSAGYWMLLQTGDPANSDAVAASGGLIATIGYISRRRGEARLWTLPRFMFDAQVCDAVVAVTAYPEVLEAVDEQGRDLIVPPPTDQLWGPPMGGHMHLSLRALDPPSDRVAKLRVRYHCAVRTRDARMELDGLDHDHVIELVAANVAVRIHPLDTESSHWRLTIDTQRQLPELIGTGDLRPSVYLVSKDNTLTPITGGSGRGDMHASTYTYRMKSDSFDPATTRLIIVEPAAIELVPVELTFRDIAIRLVGE
jgi:hypothetical protein